MCTQNSMVIQLGHCPEHTTLSPANMKGWSTPVLRGIFWRFQNWSYRMSQQCCQNGLSLHVPPLFSHVMWCYYVLTLTIFVYGCKMKSMPHGKVTKIPIGLWAPTAISASKEPAAPPFQISHPEHHFEDLHLPLARPDSSMDLPCLYPLK